MLIYFLRVERSTEFYDGDNICHDFLSRDLMEPLVVKFENFLDSCHLESESATLKTTERQKKRKRKKKIREKKKEEESD